MPPTDDSRRFNMTTNSIHTMDAPLALPIRWLAISPASAMRLFAVLAILIAEAIVPSVQTARRLHFVAGDWMEATLVQQVGGRMRYFALASAAMVIFLSWSWLRRESICSLEEPSQGHFGWILWLIPNAIFSLALIGSVPALTRWTNLASMEAWLALRSLLAIGALATGALALMPARFWLRWLRENQRAFRRGIVLGLAVQGVGFAVDKLWRSASVPTLWTAAWGLRLCGRTVAVYPEKLRLVVPGFGAMISPSCSGIEGIGLVVTFLGFYLWWYRKDLHLPRALILLPIGIAGGWMLNVLRIMVLILIGTHHRRLAVSGFHSAAGWLLFNGLCFGIVTASWRFDSLSKSHPKIKPRPIEATFYLAPLLVIAITGMITHAMTVDFDVFYPLRVIVTMATLLYFHRQLALLRWTPSGAAIGLGAVVFVIWMAFARGGNAGSDGFIEGMRQLSHGRQGCGSRFGSSVR